MTDMDYCFEQLPWEQEMEKLNSGDRVSALRWLSVLESADELAVEEAMDALEQRGILLDISDLPPVPLSGSAALRLKQESEFSDIDRILQGLDENDPLRLYVAELAATPAAGDPQLLAERYCAGEHHLAEQLVCLCLSQVLEQALDYTGHGVLLLDLIQEGSLGLWQSILRYEGGDFLSHSRIWIRQYMAKAVFLQARSSGAGQKIRQDMEDYLDADQRLLTELGRNPTTEEIAELLHITPEECAALEKMIANARLMEKRKQQQQPTEPTPEDDMAVEDTAYFQLRQTIAELLSGLSETDAKLLSLRFGLEGGKPMTPVQTAQALGLTPEQVVAREAAALDKLRTQ